MRHLGKLPGIWDSSQDTVGSNANGGWHRFPDGVIEQWGTVSITNGSGTITFPIAFPTGCQNVILTSVSSQSSNASVSTWLSATPTTTTAQVSGRAFVTVAGLLSINAGSFTAQWRAIGT